MTDEPQCAKWWGQRTVPMGQPVTVEIGPSHIEFQRLAGEWRVSRNGSEVERFAVSGDSGLIDLTPVLADRPVVARPEHPFRIPAESECTVFMTTPLWAAMRSLEPAHALTEFVIERPSDTWFGADTLSGELCYASRSFCRIRSTDLLLRAHRAVTAVTVRNRAITPFQLERVKLPVEYFSLFESDSGWLWTQDVSLERTDDDGLSPLRLRDAPSATGVRKTALTAPRRVPDANLLVRAFTSLFAEGRLGVSRSE